MASVCREKYPGCPSRGSARPSLRWGSQRYDTGGVCSADARLADVSVKEGGRQDPKIHQIFEEELRKSGAVCRMRTMIRACTGVG